MLHLLFPLTLCFNLSLPHSPVGFLRRCVLHHSILIIICCLSQQAKPSGVL